MAFGSQRHKYIDKSKKYMEDVYLILATLADSCNILIRGNDDTNEATHLSYRRLLCSHVGATLLLSFLRVTCVS